MPDSFVAPSPVWHNYPQPLLRDRQRPLGRFRALFDGIAPTLKPQLIAAPELGYTFGKDSGGSAMNEILHALLHTGNSSNKRKLLLGRQWAQELPDGTLDTSRWDAFVSRMVSEGKVTKAHMDFVQGVWDLLEETKAGAQRTHRDVFGHCFDEVTAEPVQTPWGEYRGGYVPAMADARVVQDANLRELAEEDNAAMAYAFPTTPKGFTKARVEYNRPLTAVSGQPPTHLQISGRSGWCRCGGRSHRSHRLLSWARRLRLSMLHHWYRLLRARR